MGRVATGAGQLVQRHEVAGKIYPQIHQELMFSQSNAHICREMLHWAVEQTRPPLGAEPTSHLLELHCGNGSFTLPLAGNFKRGLATEVVRGPVRMAAECADWAGITNASFARLSAAETAAALAGERKFTRL